MPYLNIHGWHEFRWDRLTHEILFVHSSVHLFYSINAWMDINTASNKHALWSLSCQFFLFFFFVEHQITSSFQIHTRLLLYEIKWHKTIWATIFGWYSKNWKGFSIYLHKCLIICDLESFLRQKAVLKLQFWLLSPKFNVLHS